MTWLLLAALPWQGVAAAAMVMCQPATHQAASAAHQARGVPAAHAVHHGPVQDEILPGHAGLLAAGQVESTVDGHSLQTDADHHCSACSMCSHALALTGVAASLAAQPAPRARVPGVEPHLASRVAPIPDKPPRA